MFREYLLELAVEPKAEFPAALVDGEFTAVVGDDIDTPNGPFESRWDLAASLNAALERMEPAPADHDVQLWTWLAVRYFDEICPSDGHGARKVKQLARYILEPQSYQRYYRHLVAGPFRLLRAHRTSPEDCRALLAGKPDVPGELYEQIGAQQLLVSSPDFVKLVNSLYWDSTVRRLRRGAGGSSGGSPRRLTQVYKQFTLTYDFETLGATELMKLLPKEFGRFLRHVA